MDAFLAARLDLVEYLCEIPSSDLQSVNAQGETLLHVAASFGSLRCARFLVEQGLNLIVLLIHRIVFNCLPMIAIPALLGNSYTVPFVF
jgi:ankyrin repeat protein